MEKNVSVPFECFPNIKRTISLGRNHINCMRSSLYSVPIKLCREPRDLEAQGPYRQQEPESEYQNLPLGSPH